jgi:diguanylate cyclase (GGDEF)-like protein/PAS domain S-box-containing protein
MERNLQELLSMMYEGVYIVDKERKIIFWNSGSENITGYKAEEVINKYCFNNILQHVTEDGKHLCLGGCPLHHTLQSGKINEANVYLHHKEGHRVPVTVKSIPIYDGEDIVAAVEVFTDSRYKIDKLKENEELKDLLSFDQLTKIPNRRYLEFYLDRKVDEFKEFKTTFGILFFDIDNFKDVNDFYGHNIGDEILKLVANTLSTNIRTDDVIGRWGGEEFIGIINCSDLEVLYNIAEKLRILVSKSYYNLVEADDINVTISIGGTVFRETDTVQDVVERADMLMYKSKRNGRNQVHVE